MRFYCVNDKTCFLFLQYKNILFNIISNNNYHIKFNTSKTQVKMYISYINVHLSEFYKKLAVDLLYCLLKNYNLSIAIV